jgi:hypothetical protein
MEHGLAAKGRLKSWLIGILLTTAIVVPAMLAFKYWARAKTMEIFDVPLAIYDTGSLVDFFHVHKQKHGHWPEPGFVHARDAVFVRSFKDRQGVRVDVYDFGRGQQAWFYFNDRNIQAMPVRGGASTMPSGGAP